MKRLKILIPVIFIFLFSFLPTGFAQVTLGQKVPDFETSTLDGKGFALRDLLQEQGIKVLILTFFATWCELSDDNLKYFQRLHDQYADQGVRVFCVFTGRLSKIKSAKKYMEEREIDLPVLLDKERGISKRYKVTGLPSTYAIDREGFLRFRCLGCSEGVKIKFERNLKSLLSIPDEDRPKPEG